MRDIRILESITPSTIGGAEIYVADICLAFERLGADVSLFCPAGRSFVEYTAGRGITSTTWKTRGKLDPVTILKLQRLIKQNHIDVIHTHLSTASILGALAARVAGVPSVAHVHGLNSAACFRYSSHIIAVSEAVKRHLCSQGLDAEKIKVVHNGIDLSRFEPLPVHEAKQRLKYDPGEPLLGIFGRLSNEKGQRVAIESMVELLKHFPKARLLVVGKGKDMEALKETAQRLGIERNVEFTGFVQDIRSLISACDIVLTPSLKEGFGMAAIEAMASERPVVASAVGGLNEIVVDGETGFLTPPLDSKALADHIKQILDDKSLATRMGKSGRDRVESCFEQTTQMKTLLSTIRDVCKI